MPFPVAAAVAAGASLLGTGANMAQSGKLNKKNRQWQEAMYHTQRQDALKDWNLQNEYNSPAAQMERFKAAGLNPNLIYGQTNEAGTMRSSSTGSYDAKAPDISQAGTNAMLAGQAAQRFQLETDLLRGQAELQKRDMAIKEAQKIAMDVGIEKARYGNYVQSRTLDYQVDYRKKINEKIDQDILQSMGIMDISTGRYNMEREKNTQAIENMQEQIRASQAGRQLSLAHMSKIRAEINNIERAGNLQEFEIKMQELLSNVGGSTPAGMLFKIIMGLAGKFGGK